MKNKKVFSGIFTALITPFKENNIDYDSFSQLFEWQIDQGINGIVICGSTGEAHCLGQNEYERLIKLSVEVNKGRVPLIVGVPSNCTEEVINIVNNFKNCGVDAFLVSAPYYNRPTQEGIFLHFKTMSEKAQSPIIAYNVPHRCGVDIENSTMLKIMDLENIVAIKEASDNIERPTILSAGNNNVSILSGNDTTYAAFRIGGGHGCISVASNVIPGYILKLEKAIKKGNLEEVKKLHMFLFPIIRSFFLESNPIPIKYAVGIIKKYVLPDVRLPLLPASDRTRKIIKQYLAELEIN